MARIHCQCGATMVLPASYVGRAAKCDACGRLLYAVAGDGVQPAPGDQVCPSCQEQLEVGANICVRCGIYAGSGRPVLIARGVDEDMLQVRSEKVIRLLSWLMPFGIYPIYSEARGKSKPYVTWAIVALTCLVSTWFWVHELSGSTTMRSLKNLMLWSGQVEPDADHIIYFYNATDYGDSNAFIRKRDELADTVPQDELDVAAHKALTVEQQSVGQYRHSQLITHALLHADIFHLAGNLLFLVVFGSRVNAAIGNIATVIFYPLLAVVAGLAHAASSAGQMPAPMLGASGAIMGMAGMYLVLFPLHKVHMVIWMRWGLLGGFRLSRKFFALRGIIVVMFYIAFDIVYTALGLESGTAHWAHLGGFIGGIVLAVVLLAVRLVYSGSDLLSLVLGKYAWPLIGSPSGHAQSRTPGDQTMMMPPDQR